ncbi:MAG: DNA polymerase III subunit gamma/tau [Burkholderiales bacterium]
MAHQVLARKWRPRKFEDVIGQEHVVKALANALDSGRIHHAYLFTGTRGVGKTTLARILAKALNCLGVDGKGGITSTPCGVCQACTDIDVGRFVDLLEVDAATNTKVDEMRELLETAQYAPVSGRYKVYIIDEVHMLSKSAFNAMLKTLEEPPGHVEFILATTDPQKLPITVLSRCLQFNLRNLAPSALAEHLAKILRTEQIAFEVPALDMIGRAGEGSVRDSLSLLDQAIAYGAGAVKSEEVAAMLGALDQTYLFTVLEYVAERDTRALVAEIEAIASRAISFELALKEIATLMTKVALVQTVGSEAAIGPDAARLGNLAGKFAVDEVQLLYQIALLGRRDLHLAPDEQSGFTMTMLRAIAFLQSGDGSGTGAKVAPSGALTSPTVGRSAAAIATSTHRRMVQTATAGETTTPYATTVAPAVSDWPAFVASCSFTGMAGMLAKQSEFVSFSDGVLSLKVAEAQKHLADKKYQEKLKMDLAGLLGENLRIQVMISQVVGHSLAAAEDRTRSELEQAAIQSINNDPFIKSLADEFGATIDRAAIRPAG